MFNNSSEEEEQVSKPDMNCQTWGCRFIAKHANQCTVETTHMDGYMNKNFSGIVRNQTMFHYDVRRWKNNIKKINVYL